MPGTVEGIPAVSWCKLFTYRRVPPCFQHLTILWVWSEVMVATSRSLQLACYVEFIYKTELTGGKTHYVTYFPIFKSSSTEPIHSILMMCFVITNKLWQQRPENTMNYCGSSHYSPSIPCQHSAVSSLFLFDCFFFSEQTTAYTRAAVAKICFYCCSIVQQFFFWKISTKSMMGNNLKRILVVVTLQDPQSLQNLIVCD